MSDKYKELRELAEKATPGPRMVSDAYDSISVVMGSAIDSPHEYFCHEVWSCDVDFYEDDNGEAMADAEFIAAANPATIRALLDERDALVEALTGAVAVITDYLEYEHDGDPWKEDARAMREMDIDDYENDGRLAKAVAAIEAAKRQEGV